MDYIKSAYMLLGGTLKRVWWYLPPLLLDPFDIAKRLWGVNILIPQWVSWILFGLGWFIAVVLAYHELRMQNITMKSQLDDIKNARPTITVKPIEEQDVWYLLVTNNGAKGNFTAQLQLESNDINVMRLTRLHHYQGFWDNPDGSNADITKGQSAKLRIAVIESARPLAGLQMHLYFLQNPGNCQTIPTNGLYFGATMTDEAGNVQPLPPPEEHRLLVTISAEPELCEGVFQEWYRVNYNGLFLDTNYQPNPHKEGS